MRVLGTIDGGSDGARGGTGIERGVAGGASRAELGLRQGIGGELVGPEAGLRAPRAIDHASGDGALGGTGIEWAPQAAPAGRSWDFGKGLEGSLWLRKQA